MAELFRLINQFSDLISDISANRDKFKIDDYEIERTDMVVVVTIYAADSESAKYVEQVISKLFERLESYGKSKD